MIKMIDTNIQKSEEEIEKYKSGKAFITKVRDKITNEVLCYKTTSYPSNYFKRWEDAYNSVLPAIEKAVKKSTNTIENLKEAKAKIKLGMVPTGPLKRVKYDFRVHLPNP